MVEPFLILLGVLIFAVFATADVFVGVGMCPMLPTPFEQWNCWLVAPLASLGWSARELSVITVFALILPLYLVARMAKTQPVVQAGLCGLAANLAFFKFMSSVGVEVSSKSVIVFSLLMTAMGAAIGGVERLRRGPWKSVEPPAPAPLHPYKRKS